MALDGMVPNFARIGSSGAPDVVGFPSLAKAVPAESPALALTLSGRLQLLPRNVDGVLIKRNGLGSIHARVLAVLIRRLLGHLRDRQRKSPKDLNKACYGLLDAEVGKVYDLARNFRRGRN